MAAHPGEPRGGGRYLICWSRLRCLHVLLCDAFLTSHLLELVIFDSASLSLCAHDQGEAFSSSVQAFSFVLFQAISVNDQPIATSLVIRFASRPREAVST